MSVFIKAGVYILENTPPPPLGEENISANVTWGKKNEKVKRKRGKFKRKRKKGKRKRRKGKENEKRRVKGKINAK